METMEITTAAAAAGKPGYKLTRFGWIPEEWEVTKLKKCCQLIKDGTHFSPVSKDGPRMYITSKNIRNGHLDLRNLSYISEEEHRSIYSRCPVQKGDILLTKDGASTGNVCQNPLEEEFSLLSSVAVIRTDEKKAYNSYLLQFLLSPIGVKAIDDEIAGQAITRITLDKIQAIQVPLPSLEEQRRITNFLDGVDKSVRLLTDLVKAKNAYKRGLMQQLLTGQLRFPEFQGQPWREVKLGEVFGKKSMKNVGNRVSLVITVGKYAIRPQLSHFNRSVASSDLSAYNVIEPGDFVYDPMSAYYGAIGRYDLTEAGVVSPVYRVLTIQSGFDTDFAKQLLKSPYILGRLDNASTQGNKEGKRRGLQDGAFNGISFKCPPLPEQQRIATVLTACDQEIELLQAQLRQWQQQKKGLMQHLLTGQLRVPH